MIVDLILMGKLIIRTEDGTNFLGYKREKCSLVNGDAESPLPEQAAFMGDFLKVFTEHNSKKAPKTVEKWMEDIVLSAPSFLGGTDIKTYIDLITNSLIAKSIVRKESVWNGSRFPTDDPTAEAAVKDRMRAVIVDGAEPDLFTTVLVQLSVEADKTMLFSNPFMRSVLSKEEYKNAGPRLKELKEMADTPLEEEAK
eukprot:CAMPEP_0119328114 /NCGR_PEP_ID=MMETSP1333-20130426/72492_1 /TAXON_ID=418940 /ORGANISM="Scyphosphaera apsteinii, Strain RCC1455" /LENGTH=196 /DNA_ID=CAMNT_0007336881 /DNA_START=72 /DNA_END=662 /DNA_ORIENTATION=+